MAERRSGPRPSCSQVARALTDTRSPRIYRAVQTATTGSAAHPPPSLTLQRLASVIRVAIGHSRVYPQLDAVEQRVIRRGAGQSMNSGSTHRYG